MSEHIYSAESNASTVNQVSNTQVETVSSLASIAGLTPVTAVLKEEANYLDFKGEQLYHVWHPSATPIAQILLAGHFVTERPFAYAPWVRWSRYLAARGISALRFDYRGCGESTGAFEHFTMASWLEDSRFFYDWLRQKAPQLPVILSGIGLGGLLAGTMFNQGAGSAMLLWSPSASGSDALRDTLLRRLAFDMSNPGAGRSMTWADYKTRLEQGESMAAAGHMLTPALWREAAQLKLVLPEGNRDGDLDSGNRPWRVVKLGQAEVPLVPGGGLWQALNPGLRIRRAPLNPDLKHLFEADVRWIHSNLYRMAMTYEKMH
jgi:hypothetical protein